MASINKKDRDFLYGRAATMAQQAGDIDDHADQLMRDAMPARAAAHRVVAEALRSEARECRKWADQWSDE